MVYFSVEDLNPLAKPSIYLTSEFRAYALEVCDVISCPGKLSPTPPAKMSSQDMSLADLWQIEKHQLSRLNKEVLVNCILASKMTWGKQASSCRKSWMKSL